MQNINIAITGWGSISPLGINHAEVWQRYQDDEHCFTKALINAAPEWVARLCARNKAVTAALITANPKYNQLDPCVWYAMTAAQSAVNQAGWHGDATFGVNIGSSRGATTAFEKHHTQFIQSGTQITHPLTSPLTTLGNIASWTAAHLATTGPVISHSITCSTALHAVLNAVAWLRAGFCTRFLAGGSEAPLTAFTIAQMRALKIYSSLHNDYPCRAMDPEKKQNTMILGEGAACFCLETSPAAGALAYISGIGYGTETIDHGASLTADALCLQRSMQMALQGHALQSVDAVILHAPGTLKGDTAELQAIQQVFGLHTPLLTNNKWKMGHAFGASGAFSLELAMLMLQHNQFIQPPYLPQQQMIKPLKKILVNATGFGGNAVSVLLSV
jgi:3-oxoacyl-[acyl-carrier-protein] synthase II